MNRIRSNLLLKTTLSILTVVLAVSIVFCTLIIGAVSLLEGYTNPDNFMESVDRYCLSRDFDKLRSNIRIYYENADIDPTGALPEDEISGEGTGRDDVELLSTSAMVIEPIKELSPDKTNVRFIVYDNNGNEILSNTDQLQGIILESNLEHVNSAEYYSESREFTSYEQGSDFYNEIDSKFEIMNSDWDVVVDDGVERYILTIEWRVRDVDVLNIRYCYADQPAVRDSINTIRTWASAVIEMRYYLLVFDCIALIVLVMLLVILCSFAGYHKHNERPACNVIDKIPFDIYIPLVVLVCGITLAAWSVLMRDVIVFPEQVFTMILISLVATLIYGIVILSIILTVVTRIKTGTLLKNTVIARIIKLFWKIICGIGKLIAYLVKNIPLYFKAAIVTVFLVSVELCVLIADLFLLDYGFYGIEWIFIGLLNAVIIPLSVYCVIQFGMLRRGAKKIAQGESGYLINTKGMVFEFREHAKTLNHIQDGLQREVNERIKSERFKTELITNVSHDIKTPLTSIINYVDLLKNEQMPSEDAAQYVEVLDRQSVRLKKLINDLIEVSKASTGNISVNIDNPDIGMIINQAYGEFEDKLTKIGVSAVINTPENCKVRADGRLLWRVFDNLIGNVCKYSQENTRFYIDTEVTDDRVVVSLKNTSKYQLNITKDELMERFTRGDASRHTDGSGLGLSIAKSLLELQEGALDIFIDGDFFKVTVDLPKA